MEVPYNRSLSDLEKLLSGVKRPGDYFVRGTLEIPMPRIQVEGLGLLAFPLPLTQIQDLIRLSSRAPYGRGSETILDTTVRKVWQLPASKVRIGGKSWDNSFNQVLSILKNGLGCAEAAVSAELYKLLIYDEGGFFKAHRDTEKAKGMFGTLVVVLPSLHSGGELIVRHGGREVSIDLHTEEISEIKFAAFYADCEHEVKPVTDGNRVCLVYNLIQQHDSNKGAGVFQAPLYESEIESAAKLLASTFSGTEAPAKLAWLLEHQYSPAELSFDKLKNTDAALAKVIRAAASKADCTVHLGIVHIGETGPAQPVVSPYYGRRSRWSDYGSYGGKTEENVSSKDYEVVEITDTFRDIDQWIDSENRPSNYGKVPLQEGELLPSGGLDNEEPDTQRLMEATGNEGASFERSYHRAVLVIWPREKFAYVLLQGGISSVLPHLKDRIDEYSRSSTSQAARGQIRALAQRIINKWKDLPPYPSYREFGNEPSRSEMIILLAQIEDTALLEDFISSVVISHYDGSENKTLVEQAKRLQAKATGELFSKLMRENMKLFHVACVDLLHRLTAKKSALQNTEWKEAWHKLATAVVEGLPKTGPESDNYDASNDWRRRQKAKPIDAQMIANLLESLIGIGDLTLLNRCCVTIEADKTIYDPSSLIIPALELLHRRTDQTAQHNPAFRRLWLHSAEFLLVRSEHPPTPPKDWRQNVTIQCRCEDCRELEKFALDPIVKTYRFRVRQDRRAHLHRQIEIHGLDMTHDTERKGSPQTLVCVKTRDSHTRKINQHRDDCASMAQLLSLISESDQSFTPTIARLAAAKDRKPLNP